MLGVELYTAWHLCPDAHGLVPTKHSISVGGIPRVKDTIGRLRWIWGGGDVYIPPEARGSLCSPLRGDKLLFEKTGFCKYYEHRIRTGRKTRVVGKGRQPPAIPRLCHPCGYTGQREGVRERTAGSATWGYKPSFGYHGTKEKHNPHPRKGQEGKPCSRSEPFLSRTLYFISQ